MSFDQLGLSAALLRAVQEIGYTVPTPIQTNAIPAVHDGRDLLAAAQTGTGKTAAFALPLLQRLEEEQPQPPRLPRAATARARADTRTCRAGRPVVRRLRPPPAPAHAADLRWREPKAADRGAPPRRGHRRRDARPPARSHQRARHRRHEGPLPRARRSRPHARHGIHPRHPPRAGRVAEAAPEPAVLRDLLRRDPHARERTAARPAHRRGGAAQRARRARRASSASRRARREACGAEPPAA